MTPYDKLLKWHSVPGYVMPRKWMEAIRALPPDDVHWRKDKRRVNRAVRLVQRSEVVARRENHAGADYCARAESKDEARKCTE